MNTLFVYGSLLSSMRHIQGERLRREARLVSPATIAGRLYRVSWYPALRPAVTEDDRVHGEVYLLADPVRTLIWLDAYEGLTRDGDSAAEAGEYAREQRAVTLETGEAMTAWVYLYLRPLPEPALVTDGIWRG